MACRNAVICSASPSIKDMKIVLAARSSVQSVSSVSDSVAGSVVASNASASRSRTCQGVGQRQPCRQDLGAWGALQHRAGQSFAPRVKFAE